jgi:hypothetical protein
MKDYVDSALEIPAIPREIMAELRERAERAPGRTGSRRGHCPPPTAAPPVPPVAPGPPTMLVAERPALPVAPRPSATRPMTNDYAQRSCG